MSASFAGPRVWSRLLPHVIAAFIVLHVVASCADVLPNPGPGMDRRAWREPRVRHELNIWADRLGLQPASFEETLWRLATSWVELRRAITAPFRPYLTVSGVKQSWGMFVAGTRYRDRFQIRARSCPVSDSACDWQALYTRGVFDESWRRDVLEHPRVRSGTFRWVWPDHTARYKKSCSNLARLAFTEHPALEVVQCRFERSVAPAPHPTASARREPPTWGREVVVSRRDVEGRSR